jgi:hypothetical protein
VVPARVASIQRLNTTGGISPPPQTRDQEHAGSQARVPYTATYYFYLGESVAAIDDCLARCARHSASTAWANQLTGDEAVGVANGVSRMSRSPAQTRYPRKQFPRDRGVPS